MFRSLFKSHSTAPSVNIPQSTLKIPFSHLKIIELISTVTIKNYPSQHIFISCFLKKFITLDNKDLLRQTNSFIKKVNKQGLSEDKLFAFGMKIVQDTSSPLWTLTQIWKAYIQFEIKDTHQNVHTFLVKEIHKFSKAVASIMVAIDPRFSKHSQMAKFTIYFLDYLSNCSLFAKVMKTYLTKYNLTKGVNGQSNPEQIKETKTHFQKLVNFYNIERPFEASIDKFRKFYLEHRLIAKVLKLVDAVKTIRQEITEYRQRFAMGPAAIGGQQLMPVLNFVCQKTGFNILASAAYINAFVGHSDKEKEQLLGQLARQAWYTLSVVEAAASFYCHASQIS